MEKRDFWIFGMVSMIFIIILFGFLGSNLTGRIVSDLDQNLIVLSAPGNDPFDDVDNLGKWWYVGEVSTQEFMNVIGAQITSLPICGDVIVNGDEDCDDGNFINGDGCSSYCKIEVCTLEGMVCHDGSVVGRDPVNNCEFFPCPPECGNNILEEGETCDGEPFCGPECTWIASECNNGICERPLEDKESCAIDCRDDCLGYEICGNGFDDNCIGGVDELCIEAVSCRDPRSTLGNRSNTYYLTQDIEIDRGICFFINADDITLDLQGHSIILLDETPSAGAIGVKTNNKNNIVIKNGFIRGFPTGISLKNSDNSKVQNVDVTTRESTGGGGSLGIEVSGDNTILGGNTVSESFEGIIVEGDGALVVGNTIYDSTFGLNVENAALNLEVIGNNIYDNNIGAFFLESNTEDVSFNTFSNNEEFDVLCEAANGEFSDNIYETIAGCPLDWNICAVDNDCGVGMRCVDSACVSDFSPRCDPFFSSQWNEDGDVLDGEKWDRSNLNSFLDVVPLEGEYALQARGDSAPGNHRTQRWVQEFLDNEQVIGGTVHVNFAEMVFDGATDIPFIGFYNAIRGYTRDLAIVGVREDSHSFIYLKGYHHSNSPGAGPSQRFLISDADYGVLSDPWPDRSVRVDWFTTPTYNLYARVDEGGWRKMIVGNNQVSFIIVSAGWISSFNGGNVKIKDVALYDEECVPQWVLDN